jgi:hypothetical protein
VHMAQRAVWLTRRERENIAVPVTEKAQRPGIPNPVRHFTEFPRHDPL